MLLEPRATDTYYCAYGCAVEGYRADSPDGVVYARRTHCGYGHSDTHNWKRNGA